MDVYIEYDGEFFRGIVGPFEDRPAADDWAHRQGGTASWQGASVYKPEEAALLVNPPDKTYCPRCAQEFTDDHIWTVAGRAYCSETCARVAANGG